MVAQSTIVERKTISMRAKDTGTTLFKRINASDVQWAGLKNQAERAAGVHVTGNRLSFDSPEAAAAFADTVRTFAVAHEWAEDPDSARAIHELADKIDCEASR